MTRRWPWAWLLAWCCAFGGWSAVCAQDLQPVPVLTSRVIDRTGTLSAPQLQALVGKLEAIERESGAQLVVLLVPTTAPEDIAAYAQRVGEQWRIGRKDVGDGLLIVVAKNDRRVRIEVAKSLEGAVPDLLAKRVIEQQLTPAFRQNDFAGGLNLAVDRLGSLIKGEGLPAPAGSSAREAQPGVQWNDLMMFLFVAVPILGAVLTAVLGRRAGSMLTALGAGAAGWALSASVLLGAAAFVVAWVVIGLLGVGAVSRRGGPVIWSGGGSSSSSSGGGFSSGGGGDFGGGGASGSW